jgi:hypothetical protein
MGVLKRLSALFLSAILLLSMSACGTSNMTSSNSSVSQQTEKSVSDMNEKEIKMTVGETVYTIMLYDTPAANSFYQMLPMTLTFSDYNKTEKIAYPNEKLKTDGEPDGFDPSVGDFCLYAPWGNIALFYNDFGYSDGLVSLGYITQGIKNIASLNGDFTVTFSK